MNFDLTSERQMLQESLRRFLSDRYPTDVRNELLASDAGVSPVHLAPPGGVGILGRLFREAQGG